MPQIEVIVNAGSGSVLEGESHKKPTKRFIALGVRTNHLAKSGNVIL